MHAGFTFAVGSGYGGSALRQNTGWRYLWRKNRTTNPVADWNNTDALWAVVERLKAVMIECDDAVLVVERYGRNPRTLIYCDPPYVRSTRSSGSNYEHEMSDSDHVELAQAIHSVEAMVLISGYDCPLYRELYSDWAVATKETLTNGGGAATECLWISPRCQSARLPLFAMQSGLRSG